MVVHSKLSWGSTFENFMSGAACLIYLYDVKKRTFDRVFKDLKLPLSYCVGIPAPLWPHINTFQHLLVILKLYPDGPYSVRKKLAAYHRIGLCEALTPPDANSSKSWCLAKWQQMLRRLDLIRDIGSVFWIPTETELRGWFQQYVHLQYKKKCCPFVLEIKSRHPYIFK